MCVRGRGNIAVFVFSHCVLWIFAKLMVLSFFANLTRRLTGVRKIKNKRGGCNSPALLEALVQRFIWFGENDVRPRVIQTRRIGGPGRG
mgnify:CR=1 FL=1